MSQYQVEDENAALKIGLEGSMARFVINSYKMPSLSVCRKSNYIAVSVIIY